MLPVSAGVLGEGLAVGQEEAMAVATAAGGAEVPGAVVAPGAVGVRV
jgi:hypothetical protein